MDSFMLFIALDMMFRTCLLHLFWCSKTSFYGVFFMLFIALVQALVYCPIIMLQESFYYTVFMLYGCFKIPKKCF